MSSDKNQKKSSPTPPVIRRGKSQDQPEAAPQSEQPEQAAPESQAAPEGQATPEQKPAPAPSGPGRRVAPGNREESQRVSFDKSATMEDFAAMLGEAGGVPQRRRFKIGEQVEGTVVTIGHKYIVVDLGTPYEGVAEREFYTNDEGELELEVGQEAKFYIVSMRGGIQLGKEFGGAQGGDIAAIEAAYETGAPVRGKVTATNKGGFEVDLGGVQAFCPISQIDTAYTEDPNVHVGQSYQFKVTDVREGGRTVVVSRAALLREEQEAARAEALEHLEVGQRITGTVTRLTDFGAFVDVGGGVEGLVHVSEITHGFFDKPADVVREGEQVEVEVLSIEEPSGKGPLRISLSMKAVEEDPWVTVNERFAVGQKVEGTVVRLAPFGAFVELSRGLDGLVHVSEISWERHVANPADVLSVGQRVRVEIQDIDMLRRRISLSMKAVADDPWNSIEERYAPGLEVSGFVEKVEDFGAFVNLGGGITALLPRSEMGLSRDATPHRVYTAGQEVTARVLSVEPERRRMALTLKDASEIQAQAPRDAGATSPGERRSDEQTGYSDTGFSGGSFGTLGDFFKKKKS